MIDRSFIAILAALFISSALAGTSQAHEAQDTLIKFATPEAARRFAFDYGFSSLLRIDSSPNSKWVRVLIPQDAPATFTRSIFLRANIVHIEPNERVYLADSDSSASDESAPSPDTVDNLPVPNHFTTLDFLRDKLFDQQWGLADIGITAKSHFPDGTGIIVAVIDSGVDYTHLDLRQNIWRNEGEFGIDADGNHKSTNNIDDDENGFVDDIIGWDFVDDDRLPYDVISYPTDETVEYNPGHGTHCAGIIAASKGNGYGIAGVAPRAKIMPLRAFNSRGSGTIYDEAKAMDYAVANGAKIISGSFGVQGRAKDLATNKILREAIQNAEDHGVLLVFAAGNGDSFGKGLSNDGPVSQLPASFDYENIISVAATDEKGQLADFSNWGLHKVHLAAPGVRIISTVPQVAGSFYKMSGTSMACPFVAGAAAAYWSDHPRANFWEVKRAILSSVTPVPALKRKTISGGKLNVKNLMAH